MLKLIRYTLIVLFLSCPWVFGQSPFADFPIGDGSRVSPDKSFRLNMNDCQPNSECDRRLWLVNNSTRQQKLLMDVVRTVRIGWAPAGSAFFLNDDFASNEASAYLYFPAQNRHLDIGALLDKKFPKDRHFEKNSHHYINGLRWINKDEIIVRRNGHFDRYVPGGNEFAVCYSISTAGKVIRLSETRQENSPCQTE